MLGKLLRTHLRPYRRLLAGLLLAQFVSVITNLLLPAYNAAIIDRGIVRGDIAYIWQAGGWMLLIAAGQVIAAILSAYLGARIAMGFGKDVRARLFSHIQAFSAREIGSFGAPSLITRTTNDVQQIQSLVMMGTVLVLTAPFMMGGGILMAWRQDSGLSWVMVAAIPVLAAAIAALVRLALPWFRIMQKRVDAINRVLREQLSGVRVVRAFVRQKYEQDRFEKVNAALRDTNISVGRVMVAIFPVVSLVMNLSGVVLIWFGGKRIVAGQMTIGSLLAFMTYLIMVLMSVLMASFILMQIPRSAICAERITAVFDEQPSLGEPLHPVASADLTGNIVLEKVSMHYSGAKSPVLDDVSAQVLPGETLGIIGSTGSGKSTLIAVMSALIAPTSGRVLYDGHDLPTIPRTVFWGHLGFVPQTAYLFTGTIASNVRYGNPQASDREVWEALKAAQADDFVRALDKGLHADVAQGGTNFSGGQRQRLCLARALVARPRVYLLDDVFSALDTGTEARIRESLRDYTKHAAVVMVSARAASIRNATKILVLDAGQVAGYGNHAELQRSCAIYREIIASQEQEAA